VTRVLVARTTTKWSPARRTTARGSGYAYPFSVACTHRRVAHPCAYSVGNYAHDSTRSRGRRALAWYEHAPRDVW
jgi:hypothetical protein